MMGGSNYWYALKHPSGELLSWQGAILVHDSREELEFLIPGCVTVDLHGSLGQIEQRLGRRLLLWKDHLKDQVRFPINKNDFWW